MRRGPIFAMILLPLAGCVPPPGGPGYGYGGYPQPYQGGGYAPPVYGDPNAGYSGYAYNDGAPYIVEEGVTLPLIFFGGAWGYYDRERHFRRAPEHVYRELQSRHPGGSGAAHAAVLRRAAATCRSGRRATRAAHSAPRSAGGTSRAAAVSAGAVPLLIRAAASASSPRITPTR